MVGDVVINVRGVAKADFVVPERHVLTAAGETMVDIRMVQRKKEVDVRMRRWSRPLMPPVLYRCAPRRGRGTFALLAPGCWCACPVRCSHLNHPLSPFVTHVWSRCSRRGWLCAPLRVACWPQASTASPSPSPCLAHCPPPRTFRSRCFPVFSLSLPPHPHQSTTHIPPPPPPLTLLPHQLQRLPRFFVPPLPQVRWCGRRWR